jgi:signal transduction histidine kinase/ligand-binding sensor domain-containing protein
MLWALDPAAAPDDYGVATWTVDIGLPGSTITALAQTHDGYLWAGTADGLARFNGVRFERFDTVNTPALFSSSIDALAVDSDDTLWIGTAAGVAAARAPRRRGDWAAQPALGDASLAALLPGNERALWLAGARRGVQRWRAGRLETLLPPPDPAGFRALTAYRGFDGALWVGSATGVQRFGEGGWRTVLAPADLPDPRITALTVQRDGTVWVGMYAAGAIRMREGRLDGRDLPAELAGDAVRNLLEDRDGNVWIGTNRHGLWRYSSQSEETGSDEDGRFERFSDTHPLAAGSILALLEDREGNLWVGTGAGLYRLRDVPAIGIAGDVKTTTVFVEHDGSVWLGTTDKGLFRFEARDGRLSPMRRFSTDDGLGSNSVLAVLGGGVPGTVVVAGLRSGLLVGGEAGFVRLPGTDSLADASVRALFRDSRGRLWIGVYAGAAVVHYHDGQSLVTLATQHGYTGTGATCFAEDPAGAVWIGTPGDGLFRYADGRFSRWTRADGLPGDSIVSLYVDRDGVLWIATLGAGVAVYGGDGRFGVLGPKQGVPIETAYAFLDDGRGRLWIRSSRGLHALPKAQIGEWIGGNRQTIEAASYGRDDGLDSIEYAGGGQPAGWVAGDGRLWFTSTHGALGIDPDRRYSNPLPPPVEIELVEVNDRQVDDLPNSGIPAGPHRVRFHFSGNSLVAPDNVRFRTRLEGFDDDWSAPDALRNASYTNLAPGDYRFRVIASNNDGVWNHEGASAAFKVHAPFYRTWPAYALSSLALALLVWLAHHWQTLRLRASNAVLSERNRIAREIHDTLAQGLIGIKVQVEVAKQLIARNPAQATVHLERAQVLADASVDEAHQSVWALRGTATTDANLPQAISRVVEALSLHTPLEVEQVVRGEIPALDAERHFQILRLVREAVANVVRHAHARHLRMEMIGSSNELLVAVRDDGCGFDPESESPERAFGLTGMRERATRIGAQFSLASAPGRGTSVELKLGLPLPRTDP